MPGIETIAIVLGAIIVVGLIVVYVKIKTPKDVKQPAPTRDELVTKLIGVETQLGQLDSYRQVEIIARNEARKVKDGDVQAQLNLYLNDQIDKRIRMEQNLLAEKDKLMGQLKEMNQIGRPRSESAHVGQLDMQDNSN